MPAAYSLYKFKKMFGLVLTIFFILIVLSILNPAKEEVIEKTVSSIDTTGAATKSIEVYNSIPDPEGSVKQASGNLLYRLMNNNPQGFFVLTLIVTGLLFGAGVYLRDVRKFVKRL